MDGENDGKPNEQMDDLGGGGGETTIFENTHICSDVFFSFFFSDFYDSSRTSPGRGPIVISFGETRNGHKQIRTTGAPFTP